MTPGDARRMFSQTGCDSVMIGRACCGDPTLIGRTRVFLDTGIEPPPPDADARIAGILRQLALHVQHQGEERGVREMRSFVAWQIKGLPDAANVRNLVNRADSREQMESILVSYHNNLKERGTGDGVRETGKE
jgi:tRNA-dihydrouridine synthase B